ncbi:MAG: hypothetical protein U1E43_01305 [Rhodospirillales bacterium]
MRQSLPGIALLLAITSFTIASCPASAAEKSVALQSKFGRVVANSMSKLDAPASVEMVQEVRVDELKSTDPEWNDATLTLYEQNLSYPTTGTFRSYGVIATKSDDAAFIQLDGKWDVVERDNKFVEAPFAGEGKLLGGTGRYEKISGPVTIKGRVHPEEGATYTLQLTIRD